MKALIFSVAVLALSAQAHATCAARSAKAMIPAHNYANLLPSSQSSRPQPVKKQIRARGADSSTRRG